LGARAGRAKPAPLSETNFTAAGLNEDDLATITGWSLHRVKVIIRPYDQKEKIAEEILRRVAQLEDMR
jgi:hypothetical protein